MLDDDDVARMAEHLGVSRHAFVQRYAEVRRNRQGLTLGQRGDGACRLLDGENACRVHPVKPAQCRRFPNDWRFPGWRQICEATPERPAPPAD